MALRPLVDEATYNTRQENLDKRLQKLQTDYPYGRVVTVFDDYAKAHSLPSFPKVAGHFIDPVGDHIVVIDDEGQPRNVPTRQIETESVVKSRERKAGTPPNAQLSINAIL